GRCSAAPWWNTSQGEAPIAPRIINATDRPYSHRPMPSRSRRSGMRPARSWASGPRLARAVEGGGEAMPPSSTKSGYIGYSHLCDSGCMQRALAPARLAALVGDFDRSPAWLGLHRALQELIGDGRIPVGTRLPSER